MTARGAFRESHERTQTNLRVAAALPICPPFDKLRAP
jgi:hypothetical protein